MAWYAELRRRHWYCINQMDMISMFSKYNHDMWWNSLTEEQKEAHRQDIIAKERERRREINTMWAKLAASAAIVSSLGSEWENC